MFFWCLFQTLILIDTHLSYLLEAYLLQCISTIFCFTATNTPGMVLQGLEEGRCYNIKVNYSCSTCELATLGYTFSTGIPPFGGKCTVNPTEGNFKYSVSNRF